MVSGKYRFKGLLRTRVFYIQVCLACHIGVSLPLKMVSNVLLATPETQRGTLEPHTLLCNLWS
jgi:hypothetical protein